jgi:hypothetical protein
MEFEESKMAVAAKTYYFGVSKDWQQFLTTPDRKVDFLAGAEAACVNDDGHCGDRCPWAMTDDNCNEDYDEKTYGKEWCSLFARFGDMLDFDGRTKRAIPCPADSENDEPSFQYVQGATLRCKKCLEAFPPK